MSDEKRDITPEERQKIIEALEAGRMKFSDRVSEALSRMRLGDSDHKPDFTLTDIQLHAWGPWKRIKDGREFGNEGGFSIDWSSVSAGCGSIDVYIDQDGKLKIDNQIMSKEFCMSVFKKLIDEAFENTGLNDKGREINE